ncbi:hypothetical protein, partial [Streptococcus gallolyticus]
MKTPYIVSSEFLFFHCLLYGEYIKGHLRGLLVVNKIIFEFREYYFQNLAAISCPCLILAHCCGIASSFP